MIEVRGLHKSFGGKLAVEGVSFSARDGEITALLGPNGAGKTTTLRMLYTLLKPDRGQIRVDGLDSVTQALQVQRRLGVLPDASDTHLGVNGGGGIEYFVTRHASLTAELLYHKVDAFSAPLTTFSDGSFWSFGLGAKVYFPQR